MTILSLASIDLAPKKRGIYFLYSSDKSIQYIGRSENIHNRILSHLNSIKKEHVAYFSFKVFTVGAPHEEDIAIKAYQKTHNGNLPPLNKISGFVYSPRKT